MIFLVDGFIFPTPNDSKILVLDIWKKYYKLKFDDYIRYFMES